MAELQMIQQSTNWLALTVGPFIGVSGAFILARIVDASKRQRDKLVSANLALLTLKNQLNEFLVFRKSFIEDVSRNCCTGNEPLWALIRPAFIVFGNYEFDFKSIGFLLERPGNGKILDCVEKAQISHRDLVAINELRTENAQVVQEKIVEYQKLNQALNWSDVSDHVGGNLTALLSMVAVGMGLRAERNKSIYLDAFNQLRDAFVKELDSYYLYKLKEIFSCSGTKQQYQLISIEMHKVEFLRESLPAMPKILADEIAKIPA